MRSELASNEGVSVWVVPVSNMKEDLIIGKR